MNVTSIKSQKINKAVVPKPAKTNELETWIAYFVHKHGFRETIAAIETIANRMAWNHLQNSEQYEELAVELSRCQWACSADLGKGEQTQA